MPLLIVSCSGGARMQESALSLMQMAKTSAALARLDDAGGLFISLLADPTTGGVTASFAMLGDFIIAEPKALIGFAGPRTIWNTIKVELPEGFQRQRISGGARVRRFRRASQGSAQRDRPADRFLRERIDAGRNTYHHGEHGVRESRDYAWSLLEYVGIQCNSYGNYFKRCGSCQPAFPRPKKAQTWSPRPCGELHARLRVSVPPW